MIIIRINLITENYTPEIAYIYFQTTFIKVPSALMFFL